MDSSDWLSTGNVTGWKTRSADSPGEAALGHAGLSLQLGHKAACGFPGFISEAGILNYYRSDSSLGIHVDESELDHTRPLLSFRWDACFFTDPPTAMLMHSGDVMVMSGPSRLLYHAVPRILPPPPGRLALETGGSIQTPPPQEGSVVEPVSEEEWAVCSRYIQSSRVNVTVRQVLAPGQKFPETPRSHQWFAICHHQNTPQIPQMIHFLLNHSDVTDHVTLAKRIKLRYSASEAVC
uniref:AlkB homolog 1, histone H2A dioxygenase n=1 Tax=Maylandia zebra TaxID=106582 RepID=A0A3P9B9T9_9CICH